MKVKAFITHKLCEGFSDCQDRFEINSETRSIAVSDGMSLSWQQKIWAQILVDTFVYRNDWSPTIESIKPLCQIWRDKVVSFINNLKDTNAPINIIYRSERCLAEGRSAGATFVGIRFNGNEWKGSVLGDSCLIEWDGKEADFFTSQDVETFNSFPDYFDSDVLKEGKGTPKSINGVLSEGIILLLVSDPFSDFLFEHRKQGDIAYYVQQLLTLSSHDDFEALVCEWRKEGMHNDDATLVIVENDNSDILTISYKDDIVEMIEKEEVHNNVEIEETRGKLAQEEKPFEKKEEAGNNFVVVQDNEKCFINEFILEYQRCLQKKFLKQMGKLKFRWTQKAAEEALHLLFEKYFVNIKD